MLIIWGLYASIVLKLLLGISDSRIEKIDYSTEMQRFRLGVYYCCINDLYY